MATTITERPEWQQRVVQELHDLSDKVVKLRRYLATDTYRGLPQEDQALLVMQLQSMITYEAVLLKRVERFDANR